MKRKFSKILGVGLALALLTSMLLTGAPVAANGGTPTYPCYTLAVRGDNNTSEWSTYQSIVGPYSVLLQGKNDGGNTSYVEFTPAPGTTMANVDAMTGVVGSIWYRHDHATAASPAVELRFTMPDCINPNGAGHVDVTFDTVAPVFGVWTQENISDTSAVVYFGNDPNDGTPLNGGAMVITTLNAVLTSVNAETEMTDHTATADDWELTRVRVELGWGDTVRDDFIDDITLFGFTYDMEPFDVDVTGPAADPYVCQDFEVTATIKNRGNEASNFKAIIDPGENAEWVSGGDADLSDHPQREAIVQPCETWTVTWMLHCTDPNPTTVTVKAKCDQATDWIENSTPVTQKATDLAVVITDIDDQLVGENFVVTATVTSTGPNTNVIARIDPDTTGTDAEWISGGDPDPDQIGYPIPIGDMADTDTAVVTWTLRCTADDTADVEVTATSTEDSVVATQAVTQTKPLHPILTAVITFPGQTDIFHPGQTFSVDAEITNSGDEPALDCSATISFSNELAGLVLGDSAEKDLGNIQPDAVHHANWTVICNAAGYTTITVTPAGDDDVTGESIVADDLRAGSVIVEQIPIDGLRVVITSPDDGAQYGYGETFHVTGTVTNIGASPITDATASIVIGGGDNASVSGDTTVEIDTWPYDFDWTLECIDIDEPPDYTTITVNASGTSEKTGETVEGTDDTWVYQKYLVVKITAPSDPYDICVEGEFDVTFTVTNWYTSALPSPKARITFNESMMELDGTTPDKTIDLAGPISGGGGVITVTEAWHLNCTHAGTSVVNVYVSDIVDTTTIANEDEITVNQYDGAVLDVVAEPETCEWVGNGETFVVSATVTNSGDATATSVTATLSTDVVDEAVGTGDASTTVFYLDYPPIVADSETISLAGVPQGLNVGYTIDDTTGEITFAGAPGDGVAITADYTNDGIALVVTDPAQTEAITIGSLGAESDTVTWLVECTSFCDVPITVIAAGEDICGVVTPDSDLNIVHQLPLEVVVAPIGEVKTCTTFCVTAKIWNRTCLCGEVAPFDVTGVTATITFDPVSGAALVEGESATKTIGTVYRCQSQEVEWTVHCDRIGNVDITVTATSDMPGYPVSTSDLIMVEQIRSLIRYDVPLAKGWNYMSLPIIPEDNDIVDVLAPIATQINNVWTYQAGEWLLYAPSVPLIEFTEMNDGVGYVIRAINPAVLTGQGYDLPTEPYELPPEYALQQGWNLVGFKTMDFDDSTVITNADTMAARHYLGNLEVSGGQASIIGDEARYFRTYLPGIGWRVLTDSDLMLVGKGYWLYASLENLSIVPPIER